MKPDKDLISQRFRKCLPTYDQHASIQKDMSNKMATILKELFPLNSIERLLDIGCGTGIFLKEILKAFEIQQLLINDLVKDGFKNLDTYIKKEYPHIKLEFLPGDAEEIPLEKDIQMIISNATFQWFFNLENFLKKCNSRMSKNGLIGFTTFGPENFREFRLTDNPSLDYFSLEQLKILVSQKFEVLHASEEITQLSFPNPMEVLKHLRFTGVTGTRKAIWTRDKLEVFADQYKKNFSKPEGVALTYHPIYIVARRK